MTTIIYASDPKPKRNRRRSKAAPRRSLAALLRGMAVVVVVGVCALLLARANVNTIRVQNATLVDLGAAEAQLRSYLGSPLFFLDEDALVGPFEADPWVVDVQIHRRLPGTLLVDIQEARPLFRLTDGCAVDEDARLLPMRDGVNLGSLPLLEIDHVDAEGLVPAVRTQLQALTSIMSSVPWDFGGPITGLRFGTRQLSLTRADGAEFLFASDAIERGMRRWAAVRERLMPGPLDRVDLRFQRQIVLARADVTTNGGNSWKR